MSSYILNSGNDWNWIVWATLLSHGLLWLDHWCFNLTTRLSFYARVARKEDDLTNIVSPMAALPSDTDSQQSQDLVMSLNFHWLLSLTNGPSCHMVLPTRQNVRFRIHSSRHDESYPPSFKKYSYFTKYIHHQTELLELSLALATYAFCHKNRWSIWTSSQAHTEGNVTVSTKLKQLI